MRFIIAWRMWLRCYIWALGRPQTINKMSRLGCTLGKVSSQMHNATENTMQYIMFNGPISYTHVLKVKSDVSIQ